MRALDRSMLPDTNELACLACYLLSRGLTTKQVARFLGCSPSFIRKVRGTVQRSRLDRCLGPEHPEPAPPSRCPQSEARQTAARSGCSAAEKCQMEPTNLSGAEAKALVDRIYEEVLNRGELELLRDVIAADAIDHAPIARSSLPIGGDGAIRDFLVELCTAFPDASWTVEGMELTGDTLVVRTTVSGSHHAAFRGVPSTGRQFTLALVDTFKVMGGRVVEHWGELDLAGLEQQLAVPHGQIEQATLACADRSGTSWCS